MNACVKIYMINFVKYKRGDRDIPYRHSAGINEGYGVSRRVLGRFGVYHSFNDCPTTRLRSHGILGMIRGVCRECAAVSYIRYLRHRCRK